MESRHIASYSLVAAAVSIFVGCAASEAENAPSAPPPPAVTAAEVVVRDIRDWADFTGRLEAAESVAVRARVGGYVEAVHFDEGGRVEKGDPLFTIDPRPFQAEVDRLTAERDRARAALEVARSNAARAERLFAQNAISREELEQLTADAAVAAASVAAVDAALDAAKLDLSFTDVTAPISGRVSRAIVTAGNLVDSSTLLTTVVSDDPIYAYFDIDEHTYLELLDDTAKHAGGADASDEGTVYVGLANEEGYPHAARLDFVDNQVDPDQGTIRARAVLENEDGALTPGLFARLRVVGDDAYAAALIDERAVGTDLDRKYVLVVDGQNVAQYRAVETGKIVDDLRVVTEGLDPGDVVIVNGLQRVRPGMPVAPTLVAMIDEEPAALERFAASGEDETEDDTLVRLPDPDIDIGLTVVGRRTQQF